MFTGLVEAVGEIVERAPIAGGVRLRVRSALAGDLSLGDSLAVNGVCLTVTALADGAVDAEVGPETMRVTTLGGIQSGARVNLERPLRADSRLGGHFVQGHVDAVGSIEALEPEADFFWLSVRFPSELAPFIVHRGSIAIDGISLTAAGLTTSRVDVQVVPYTMTHTNLGRARAGDPVNIECDVLGKYVARAAALAGLTMTGVRSEG